MSIDFENIKIAFNETKEDLDHRNWDKPSKAIIASDGNGCGCLLYYAGPHISSQVEAYGTNLSDLGLDGFDEGIWVWEGKYKTITYPSTPDHAEEYDTEAQGDIREPNDDEWLSIRNSMCPWDSNEWLTNRKENEKTKCSKCKIDFADENLSVDLCYYCFDQEMSAGNEKPKELMESVERLAKLSQDSDVPIYWSAKQEPFEMTGDCAAQCLNCVWNGDEGYKCICGAPRMSMDSDRIRREKENGKVARQRKMKCSGCRAGLPLGSGRYHYDKGDITVPCTHNPITGAAYSTKQKYEYHTVKCYGGCGKDLQALTNLKSDICSDCVSKEENYGVVVQRTDLNPRPKCDCGGARAKTTHSDWCSTNE